VRKSRQTCQLEQRQPVRSQAAARARRDGHCRDAWIEALRLSKQILNRARKTSPRSLGRGAQEKMSQTETSFFSWLRVRRADAGRPRQRPPSEGRGLACGEGHPCPARRGDGGAARNLSLTNRTRLGPGGLARPFPGGCQSLPRCARGPGGSAAGSDPAAERGSPWQAQT